MEKDCQQMRFSKIFVPALTFDGEPLTT